MSHPTDLNQVYGKDCIFEHHDMFTIYLHLLTTQMQGIDPRRDTLPYFLYELLGAMRNDDGDHSLGDFGEMMYSFWCAPLTPNIIHLLQVCEKNGEANKWWEKHLFYHILWQL